SRVQLVSHETLLPPPPAAVPQAVTEPVAPTAVVATVPSAASPAASPAAALPSTSKRPTQMQPAQTGRYKTEAEVFRNAPFPINP
ncbi:MAG: AfsR family transcriptional regulator, partial [Gemmatimonadaceae bacterium]